MPALGGQRRGNEGSSSGAQSSNSQQSQSGRVPQRTSQVPAASLMPGQMASRMTSQYQSQLSRSESLHPSQMHSSRGHSQRESQRGNQAVSQYDGPGSQGSQDSGERGRRMSTDQSARSGSREPSVTRSGFAILPPKVQIDRLLDVGSEAYLLQRDVSHPHPLRA